MEDEISKAFKAIKVDLKAISLKAPEPIIVVQDKPSIPSKKEETVSWSSSPELKVTLWGRFAISEKHLAKLVKEINKFEKDNCQGGKYDGKNINIDQVMFKWLGEGAVVDGDKDNMVSIAVDTELNPHLMLDAMLGHVAKYATGRLIHKDLNRNMSWEILFQDGKMINNLIQE